MHVSRMNWDRYWMLMAHVVATRSTCDRGPELLLDPGRHGVGAVLVKDQRMIASGYNGSVPGRPHCDTAGHMMRDGHCVRTLHAELNAIIQCALDGVSPQGATVYTTASPCFDCSKALVRARVARVVFGQTYESRYELSFEASGILSESAVTFCRLVLTLDDIGVRNGPER